MREFRQLPIDSVHPSPTNPRGQISDESLAELADSIRQFGVLQPIIVRANGDGFRLIAGERRWRASQLAGCQTVPGRVLELDDAAADEVTIIENLHRAEIPPLEEAEAYQRLLSAGRTIDELKARLGKSKAYIHQRVSLTRLIPTIQELLAQDILPLPHALKLAEVPADRQELALGQCFQPLFRGEEARREHVEPLANLSSWIDDHIRLNPRSDDAKVLLPTLAEQVAAVEEEKGASILAVSTLMFHADQREPKPILARSWKSADGEDACRHARPAVIEVGEGRGTFLHVCIAKKACAKHWPKPSAQPEDPVAKAQAELEHQQGQAAIRKRMEAQTEWREVLRPRAFARLATATASLQWSPRLLTIAITALGHDQRLIDLLGKPESIPVRQYPQVIAMRLAFGHASEFDTLKGFASQLGIKLTRRELAQEQAKPGKRRNARPAATTSRASTKRQKH